MPSNFKTAGNSAFSKLALVGLVSSALAGCSSDSTRLTSLSSPYPPSTQGSPEVTGSLGAAPTAQVERAPIGAPQMAYPQAAAPSGPPVAYAPTNYSAPAATYTPAPVHAAAPAAPRVSGVAHVVVGGETMASVARSYGTTPAVIATTNNLQQNAPLRVGQTLIVPSSMGNLAQSKPVPAVVSAKPTTVVAAAPLAAPVAAPVAPAAPKSAPVQAATLAPAAAPATAAVAPAKPAAPAAAAPKVAAAAATEDADDAPRAAGSGPQFRAPVRGRVISGFGPKPGGARNDGVNFAVPEGTSVRAAEDGTVAYAGNELKGYGNLVLIKHADGYVTAYAHNSEVMVKRGDTVRRGQIVAKAGQSGGVNTPQLHFEIRKGSQPVDPSQYVAGL